MVRSLARAAHLLRRAAQLGAHDLGVGGGAAGALIAPGSGAQRVGPLLSLRTFASGGGNSAPGCKGLLLQFQSPCAAAAAAAAAAAGRAAARPAAASAAAAVSPWRAISAAGAAATRQQARGYSRYLQFQPHGSGGGGWGGGSWWSRLTADSDKVLWALIGANFAGFVLWRTHPYQVRRCPGASCISNGQCHSPKQQAHQAHACLLMLRVLHVLLGRACGNPARCLWLCHYPREQP